jgi:hypothetical protein
MEERIYNPPGYSDLDNRRRTTNASGEMLFWNVGEPPKYTLVPVHHNGNKS